MGLAEAFHLIRLGLHPKKVQTATLLFQKQKAPIYLLLIFRPPHHLIILLPGRVMHLQEKH
ncbi:hypothetical protein C5Q97_14780 [Victivallales bacterium CCUG 44730]|nr:hypothetical protein C5Q97_14780 [Victivallales bacterium CCUG 44730]